MSVAPRTPNAGLLRKVLTYAGGSVVAGVCSELALVLLYGLLHMAPAWAAALAWLAGALPNYWLNRSWTWQRRGRPSLGHELLPYLAIVGVTLVLATLGTRAVDAGLRHAGVTSTTRVVLVGATFLGVYVVVFGLRFFLLDRLFARLPLVDEEPAPVAGMNR